MMADHCCAHTLDGRPSHIVGLVYSRARRLVVLARRLMMMQRTRQRRSLFPTHRLGDLSRDIDGHEKEPGIALGEWRTDIASEACQAALVVDPNHSSWPWPSLIYARTVESVADPEWYINATTKEGMRRIKNNGVMIRECSV